jgi:hypothetical protein
MNRLSRLVALFGICAAISFSTYSASEGLAARDPAAAAVTRELPWDGSESLTLEVPAKVRFVQTEGPAKVVVTGPRRSVEGFSARSGVLSDDRWHTGDAVEVVVHAPRITHFSLKGSDRLVVEGYDQPYLLVETVGRAEVQAAGRVGHLKLQLQGFGWVDMSGLKATEADVTLSGSRHALVAASDRARISGNGSVVLVSRPKSVDLDLGESGRVFTLGE